jgi:hypothetical protein
MIKMRRTQCQELISFYLVILLLVISCSVSSAQHMDATSPQMGGTSSPQMGGTSSPQMGGTSSPQMGGTSSPQMGGTSSPQMGGTSPPQIGGTSSPQASGTSSPQAGGTQSRQMGETSARQTGGENSNSINGSSNAIAADAHAITNDIGDGTVDVGVQNWRGVATKVGESHPIRLNVETIWTVDPDEARSLLASNMSLEDVRSQARAGERDAILRGNIRLNNDSYRLINITLASSGDKSTLEASLASPGSRSGSGDAASIVGHTVVTISVEDELQVAEGYMVIADSKYSGTYSLLLDEHPSRGPRAGMLGQG